MARTKEVYPTSEIAHLWAHQTQERARNPQGNFYFEGPVLYSYRDSYPIGVLVDGTRGRKGVLLNSESYSATTAWHCNDAHCAVLGLADLEVFRIDFRNDGWPKPAGRCEISIYGKAEQRKWIRSLWDARAKKIDEHIKWLAAPPKRTRATTIADRYSKYQSLIEGLHRYAEFFGIRKRFKVLPLEEMNAAGAEIKAKAERAMRAVEERERRRKEEHEERLACIRSDGASLWTQGKNRGDATITGSQAWALWSLWELPEAYMRIDPNNQHVVETTQGARVPIDAVQRAWRVIKAGQGQSLVGRPIGHYRVSEYKDNGDLVVGCHLFERAEIERFGKVLEGCKDGASEEQEQEDQ